MNVDTSNTDKVRLISRLKSQPISVGILASDWLKLSETLSILSRRQLQLLHFDIADGQFSPLFTVGSIAVKQFAHPFIKDVHLMVKDPFSVAQSCFHAGADIITLQIETDNNLSAVYTWLNAQDHPPLCGISICPETDLSLLQDYLPQVDLIQLLTLDPRTGKKADERTVLERIKQTLEMLGTERPYKLIAVDGSMNLELAKKVNQLDIDWVVSGSALFASPETEQTLIKWQTELG